MARIVISSMKNKFETIKKLNTDAGFTVSKEVNKEWLNISHHSKLNISTKKYYISSDTGEYLFYTGTLIIDSIPNASTKELFNLFNKDINQFRSNLIGNYSIIIKKVDNIYIFTDENSIANLYYLIENNNIIICNFFYYIAKTIKKITVNSEALIETSFLNAILGKETIFQEIYRLLGDKYIIINEELREIIVKNIPKREPSPLKSFPDNNVAELQNILIKLATPVTSIYNKIYLNITGGLDSRVLLSLFLLLNSRPKLIYGIGNHFLTNTKKADDDINRLIAKKYSLDYSLMDWTTEEDFENNWDSLLSQFGELFTIYGGNEKIITAYNHEKFKDSFVEYGYFGETFRNLDWLEISNKDRLHLDEILYNYIGNISFVNSNKFYGYMQKKISSVLKLYLDRQNSIKKTEYIHLNSAYRNSADTKMNNLANCFIDSISLLGINQVSEYMKEIPFINKTNAKLMVKLIYSLKLDILDIPFYSHCKSQSFNKEKMNLIPKKNLKQIIKNSVGMSRIGKIKNIFRYDKILTNRIEPYKKKVFALQKELGLDLIDVDKYNGDPRKLLTYYQYLYLIKKSYE